ncbi:MAG: glycosyltransferase family 4 protein [bacterium]
MKLFFIGSYKENPTTGGHIYNQKVIEALRELGHEIIEINVHRLPTFFRFKFFSFLYSFFKWFNTTPDLIIQVVDSALRYFPFTLFTRFHRIPIVQIVYHLKEGQTQFSLREHINYQLMRSNLKKARFIIVISQNTKSNVLCCIGCNANNKVWIVRPGSYSHNGSIKTHLYRNKKNWVFISVGAVTPRKGYDFLIEALKNLLNFQFKCYIVGDIADRRYYSLLIRKIAQYQLEKNIEFTGYLSKEKLQQLYESSDLFILSSRHEGYGIVLGEALSHGLPIVATNVGAVSEIIKDNINGFLVDPNNPADLTEKLRRLMEAPQILAALQKHIIENSEKRTWTDMKNELKKIFISILEL